MSRHKLFLDSPTQVGKNRITLPSALANYYGNTAQAYVGGRQVLSKTELDGTDYKITFTTPTPTREIEIGRGNLELTDTSEDTESRNVLDFNGSTSEYVTFSEMTLSAYTIKVVFYPRSYIQPNGWGESIIGLIGNYSNSNNFFEFMNNNNWYLKHDGTTAIINGGLIPLNYWHTVFVSYDGTTAKFNLNGVSKGSVAHSGDLILKSIGYVAQYAESIVGDFKLGRFTIWNRALSDSEIKRSTTVTNGLIHDYKITEGSGSYIDDKIGSNDGAIIGADWETDDVPIELPEFQVLHWTPASESGYYWVLTEDASGNTVYLKHEGIWVEGQLFIKVDGSWKQASDVNIKTSGEWK